MAMHLDPLRKLRPLRDDDLENLGAERRDEPAGPLGYDVYRRGDDLIIEFDVPGVEPSRLDVSVEGRTLVVTFARQLPRAEGVDVVEAGRQHGTFTRRLVLGDRWDVDLLTASTKNGVLSIVAPLVPQHIRRRVAVAAAGPDEHAVQEPWDGARWEQERWAAEPLAAVGDRAGWSGERHVERRRRAGTGSVA